MAHKIVSESPMSFNFQLYRLAELARQKLLTHATRTDHDLRCLVLHANLLDTLLLELNDGSLSSEMAERDMLPTLAAHHARLHESAEPIIFIEETGEDASDDEDGDEEPQAFLTLRASAGSPPMLSHDSDSGSDYSDDSDSEQGDDLEVESVSSSPTTLEHEAAHEVARLKSDEKESGLGLHRTISNWRFPQYNR